MRINSKSKASYTRINRKITAPQVRVILHETGEQLGVMPLQDALDIAWREELDLVEIVPNARPPVCEIRDFSKMKFDQKKKDKERKHKSVAAKEIRLRPVSSDHDVGIKIEQLKKFLLEKRMVAVNIRFKNREMMHKDNGRKIIERIIKECEELAKVEGYPKFEGSTLSVRLVPK